MPQSLSLSPKYTLIRDDLTADDVVADISSAYGINTEDYFYTCFQVVPSGDSDPAVAIYYWSNATTKWVLDKDFTALSGNGQNIAFEFKVETKGRIILPVVTSVGAGGHVSVYATTFGFSNRI